MISEDVGIPVGQHDLSMLTLHDHRFSASDHQEPRERVAPAQPLETTDA
jgi:hypothetical protein